MVFALLSLVVFDRSFSFCQLKLAPACLKPVLLRLAIVLGAVLSSALIFDLTGHFCRSGGDACSGFDAVCPLSVADKANYD